MSSAPASPSGSLSAPSRTQAINEALPFAATYFSRGRTATSVLAQEVATRREAGSPAGRVAAALVLRALLQNGFDLVDVLTKIANAPSFDYQVVSDSSAGQVRGTLDVGRWATQRHRTEVPNRYPVRASRRDPVTVENRLAVFTANKVVESLDLSMSTIGLTPQHPDHVRAAALRDRLTSVRQRMVRAAPALTRRDRSDLVDLLSGTRVRLRRRRVGHAELYGSLVTWVAANLVATPTVKSGTGTTEAAFHGPGFDATLFEIWLVSRLADGLTRRLGRPVRLRQAFGPSEKRLVVGRWRTNGASIDMIFQPSLAGLTGAVNRWSNDGGRALAGYPDIGFVTHGPNTTRRVFLLDAKLRQRRGGNLSGELYKLLGYFGNDGSRQCQLGAIVYHAPGGHVDAKTGRARSRTWWAADGGVIAAVGVEPLDTGGTERAVDALVSMIVDQPVSVGGSATAGGPVVVGGP